MDKIVTSLMLSTVVLWLGCSKNPTNEHANNSLSDDIANNQEKTPHQGTKGPSSFGSNGLPAEMLSYIKPFAETNNFQGSILVARDGQIIFETGIGYADRDKKKQNHLDTKFHLASVSRVITSCAILLLEQHGKLQTDDPIAKHLPNWPRGDEITIHHLLTLSSGIPNINTLPGYFIWSKSKQTPESLCSKFRDLPLEFEPGTKSVHSNSNYNVLALIIEKVSGQPFGKFLKTEIFDPLKMHDTAHDDHSGKKRLSNEALGYRPTGKFDVIEMETPDWTVKTGNGSIYSTARDLLKLDQMLANKTLLQAQAIEKLFKEYYPQNGYGWFVGQDSGSLVANISGRSPGFSAFWIRSVNENVTVIVLANLYSSATIQIGRALFALACGKNVKPLQFGEIEAEQTDLAAIEGTYQFGPEFYRPNGRVTFEVSGRDLFDRRGAWLIPAGKHKFIHRIYWSQLEFFRDKHGKFVKVKYDDYLGVRIK